MAAVFSVTAEGDNKVNDDQIKNLHAKIGQLTVERDFLAKPSVDVTESCPKENPG